MDDAAMIFTIRAVPSFTSDFKTIWNPSLLPAHPKGPHWCQVLGIPFQEVLFDTNKWMIQKYHKGFQSNMHTRKNKIKAKSDGLDNEKILPKIVESWKEVKNEILF